MNLMTMKNQFAAIDWIVPNIFQHRQNSVQNGFWIASKPAIEQPFLVFSCELNARVKVNE